MNRLKQSAIDLRKKGYSYALIHDRIGVSKSTLSNWLTDLPFEPNEEVLKRVRNARLHLMREVQQKKFETWKKIKDEAFTEINDISERDLFMLGLGLYMGEGSKGFGVVRVINANPEIIKLAIVWFSQICKVPQENFTLAIHLYPDNNIQKTLKFWEKETGIPLNNFGKTQIDRRLNKSQTKKRKLPYGTAHLQVKTNGNPKYGVQLFRRILAWMDYATKKTLSGSSTMAVH
jgi:transcriptional regulator with XRE-family HTH domain